MAAVRDCLPGHFAVEQICKHANMMLDYVWRIWGGRWTMFFMFHKIWNLCFLVQLTKQWLTGSSLTLNLQISQPANLGHSKNAIVDNPLNRVQHDLSIFVINHPSLQRQARLAEHAATNSINFGSGLEFAGKWLDHIVCVCVIRRFYCYWTVRGRPCGFN